MAGILQLWFKTMLQFSSKAWFNIFSMKTSEAISHFKTVAQLAEALGISVQAVYQWGDDVPKLRAYEINDLMRDSTKFSRHDEEHQQAA